MVILDANDTERALIAAELQEEMPCEIASALTLAGALKQLILRAALVILDWSNLRLQAPGWLKLQRAARGAPILILASRGDVAELENLGVKLSNVMIRPFTVGEVVARARKLLEEES